MTSVRARILRPSMVAALATLLVTAMAGAPVVGQDSDAGPALLSEARSGHTATLLADDAVLLAGGSDGDTELASVEIIDPVAASVAPLGSLTVARTDHTATLLPDGRILMAGGRVGDASLADTELLDPVSGTSEPIGDMRWARAGHTALLLDDGRVLLVGGVAGGKPVAQAEIFDPATQTFKPAAKSKATHLDSAATALPFGKVLLTGAATKKKGQAAEIYDPARDKWSAVKKAPKLTGHSSTLLRDGRVLLAGGSAKTAQVFDMAKGKFAPGPALIAKRTGHTATPLLFGEVLIVGGDENGEEVATLELFDIETDTLEPIGEMMLPRTDHTTTALSDGSAIVVGGTWAGLALDDILVYDPDMRALEPLGGVAALVEPPTDARSKYEVLAELGTPDAFLILYPDRSADPATEPVALETWTWYDTGVELTFERDRLVSEGSVTPMEGVVATPHEPVLFEAYMSLDEVLAVAGVEDYVGGPMDEAETTELYYAEQLAWGLKDGALHFIEGIALGADATSEEVE